jgi:hypothetical protein
VITEEACAAGRRAGGLCLDRADGYRQTICGSVESAKHMVPVQQRVQVEALVGVDEVPVDAPRPCPARLAMQIGPALGGRGDLESPDRIEGVEGGELLDGIGGELGHGLGGIRLEDQPWRMRRRAARGEQRSAVEDRHVGPSALGDLVGQRRTHDASSDDDDLRLTHAASLWCAWRNVYRIKQLNALPRADDCQYRRRCHFL